MLLLRGAFVERAGTAGVRANGQWSSGRDVRW
jgi:hypothetical protein